MLDRIGINGLKSQGDFGWNQSNLPNRKTKLMNLMNVSLAISVGRGFQKCLGNFWNWHMCKLVLPLKASLL